MVLHARTHPGLDVEDCFGCKAASVGVSAEATPTRRPRAVSLENVERGWHRDHAAYERLVKQGYQPPRLDGSALRESHAKTRMDIEHPLPRSFEKASA